MEGGSSAQCTEWKKVGGKCYIDSDGKGNVMLEILKKILQIEKYIGDVLLKKIYMLDFFFKKRVNSNGIVSQYYVENSH